MNSSNQSTALRNSVASTARSTQPSGSENPQPSAVNPQSRAEIAPNTANVNHAAHIPIGSSLVQTLLPTAVVMVTSPGGFQLRARALLDQGSELSFVGESLVQALHLLRRQSTISLFGVGAQETMHTRGLVQLNLQSHRDSSIQFAVEAHELPKVIRQVPATTVEEANWPQLNGLKLADPTFCVPGSVNILLGANIYGVLLTDEVRKGTPDTPVAQKTALGWIISGPTSTMMETVPSQGFTCAVDYDLHELVQSFWAQETVNSPSGGRSSKEDIECESHFVKTHNHNPSGRYVVRLPFRIDPPNFKDSLSSAAHMLRNTQRRFQKDVTLRKLYQDFMTDYAALGHMELVDGEVPKDAFYLPHHGVLRDSSLTTKLRVVFNGSQKAEGGLSLNDCLHSGPKTQTDLMDVILRWRLTSHVFCADIEKMYRQIIIHPDDRKYQRILWSEDVNQPPKHYALTTVTYGLSSAPFQAIRVLHQLAKDEKVRFPLATEVVRRNSYVDDVLGGGKSEIETREIASQVDGLLAAGGFCLQKWATNDAAVLASIGDSRKITLPKTLEDGLVLRALGLTWSPATDSFILALHRDQLEVRTPTKRSVLSLVARFFDPLDWLAPVTIIAKMFLQTLWRTNLEWDEPLPEYLKKRWVSFIEELQAATSYSVLRWLGTHPFATFELHGFSDASQDALAATIYVRVVNEDFTAKPVLLVAKTKVAPLKQVTIARLELSAAVLLAQLMSRVQSTLSWENIHTHLWTDSSVALVWIRGQPTRWKEFVANRVELIQELIPRAKWHHVAGTENPADAASRGLTPLQLSDQQLWWHGPEWLVQPSTSWPLSMPVLSEDISLEERPSVSCAVTARVDLWDLVDRYSSIIRLARITATLFRAAAWLRSHEGFSPALTPQELEKAALFWVRKTQIAYFPEEMKILQKGENLPRTNRLLRLAPFVDGDGVMRLGGRLRQSSLDDDAKHPLILPRDSKLTTLVIDDAHKQTLHGGVQLTLCTLRQKFWIIGGRDPVRTRILRCVPCARQRGMTAREMMGQLLSIRTTPSRPFFHSGVGFAGPFMVKNWHGRPVKTYKSYLVIFVCFASSAVYLEATTDYSTDGFLAAFRRFVGRRGVCATLTSDCGTNFVGADRELRKLFDEASRDFEALRNLLANDRTEWRFNPASAPHFGGKWEAGVKSAKHHIRRVIGESVLTYEQFSSVLVQVEGVLNSRPLCPLSDDPADSAALTPGHFLIGGPINALPEPSLEDVPASRLSRWQRVRQLVDQFWRIWSTEYLQRMQSISKWQQPTDPLVVGAFVLIADERYPPGKWPLARVTQVHPGSDGLVRVVTVRTAAN